jgi:membrane protein required for colicin V production
MLAASYAMPDGLTHLNWVDYAFLVILIYSAVSGAWIGFMAECVSFAGVVAGTVVAGLIYHETGKLLGNAGVPKDARDWAGFVAVFVIISLVFRLASIKGRRLSKVMVRGVTSGLAGGLLGLLVGGVLCLFILVAVVYFHIGKVYDPVQHSQIATNSKNLVQEFVTLLPDKMHHIKGFTD